MTDPTLLVADRAAAAGGVVSAAGAARAAPAVRPPRGVRVDRAARWRALVAAITALAASAVALGEPVRAVWNWLPRAGGPAGRHRRARRRRVDADAAARRPSWRSLVQIYSLGYLDDEPKPALGRYYAYQSLFAFSMMGLVLAPNLLQLFICWELVGLCSYLLIGFWYRKPRAARAAVKAFWTTKAGDVGLLIGIVLLWRLTGTFDFVELQRDGRGRHAAALPGSASSRSASTSARWASRRSSRCTSGCRTRWRARRRSPR